MRRKDAFAFEKAGIAVKTDITSRCLSIRKLLYVAEGERAPFFKKLEVHGRKADAFVFVRGGTCRYTFSDGTVFTAVPGDVFFLPKGSEYEMQHFAEPFSYVFFDFLFDTEDCLTADRYAVRNPTETASLFESLLRAYVNYPEKTFCRAMELTYQIYQSVLTARDGVYLSLPIRQKMVRAQEYIDNHFSERDLTVRSLAAACGISETYFRRMFQSVFGVSPNRQITAVRLTRAARMLCDCPELSAERISEICGFCSPQYMNTLFRKTYGVGPGHYRKQNGRKTSK